ncbi:MAG: ATP-binding protein [Candidatus Rokubacteria bacterium]|nr:ATP-binding protein [Candidatus Rokubacteria bacterium]
MSLAQRDPALHERLARLAGAARMVFVAGLPGTGKSLVIHQLAHLAAETGRTVHLLQWDVARPVFEASAAGARYPVVDGVTQPMIRKAVGAWARGAVVRWARSAPGDHVLLGETPLVGDRLMELARRRDDEAERVLGDPACRFVIAVPSVEVRRHVEAERERRMSAPRHPREREDAPPHVLRALWADLAGVAHALGIATPAAEPAYDPAVYRRVYEALLYRRHTDALTIDTVLPTATTSVYDFAVPSIDLVPDAGEADTAVREAERRYPDPAVAARDVERWWAA